MRNCPFMGGKPCMGAGCVMYDTKYGACIFEPRDLEVVTSSTNPFMVESRLDGNPV
jgi:hypothetical protein